MGELPSCAKEDWKIGCVDGRLESGTPGRSVWSWLGWDDREPEQVVKTSRLGKAWCLIAFAGEEEERSKTWCLKGWHWWLKRSPVAFVAMTCPEQGLDTKWCQSNLHLASNASTSAHVFGYHISASVAALTVSSTHSPPASPCWVLGHPIIWCHPCHKYPQCSWYYISCHLLHWGCTKMTRKCPFLWPEIFLQIVATHKFKKKFKAAS